MSENRFECVFKEHETNNCWSMIKDNQLDNPLYIRDVVDLLNEQQSRIKELEKENDDLRTTITKQVEAITEMKGIIYMLQGLRIEDYSSEIEENMVKLQKAYDGNLEDFLNYFKDGCFDE